MAVADYDETEVLGAYLVRFLDSLMTDFERRCYRLGIMRAKAEASPHSRVAERLRGAWQAEADDDVRQALAEGLGALRRQIVERVLRAHQAGTPPVHRCPRCRRILRTLSPSNACGVVRPRLARNPDLG